MIRLLHGLSVIEGWSLLALLGIAMPLKYFLHREAAVEIVGMTHGVLFLIVWALAVMLVAAGRLPWKLGLAVMGAAVIPLGWLLVERPLRRLMRPGGGGAPA